MGGLDAQCCGLDGPCLTVNQGGMSAGATRLLKTLDDGSGRKRSS